MPNSQTAALPANQPSGEGKGKSFDAFKHILKYAKPHKLTFAGIFFCALLGISAVRPD